MTGQLTGIRGAPDSDTAAGRAYHALKSEILRCELAPGADVHEGVTAERLEMSKTPVREALGMLVHEGFVAVRPRKGYRVTEVTISDVQEVYELRLLLEPAAAELAAERASPEQLTLLQQLADDHSAETYEDRVSAITRFHETLAEASGSRRLASTLVNLLDEVHRYYFLGLDLEQSVDGHMADHRELADALLRGNHHLAREIAQRQVEDGRLTLLKAILHTLATDASHGLDLVVPHRPRPQQH